MTFTAIFVHRFTCWGRLAAALAAAALLLSACGFHLRGSGAQANLPFKSVYLQAAETSSFATELRRYLASGNTPLTTDPTLAEAIVEIVSETRDKQVLSLNSQGRVREYTLQSRINFQVRTAAGNILLAPTDIVARRIQSFNENQVLAKETEETTLYRDMQSDLVQQLLRRVAAIKPPAIKPQ